MSGDEDVQVKFGAQLDGLIAGINEAKDELEGLTAPIQGIKDAFSGLGEAFAAGLALDKITEAMDKFGELGEQIERTSQITGLSSDDVQKFQFAVRMSGGDAETAAMALQRFERNMDEAATGTGTAAQAYKNLGISLKDDLTGNMRSASDVLGDIAEKYSQAADGARKVDYSNALGGRSFANLIPFLNRGRDGLQELYAILDKTGAKMSPDMVQKSAALAEDTKTLGAAWDGLAHSLEGDLLPAYDSLIKMMTSATEAATKHLDVIEKIVKAVDSFNPVLGPIEKGASMIEEQTGGWSGSVGFIGSSGGWDGSAGTTAESSVSRSGSAEGGKEKPQLPPLKTGQGEDDNGDLDYAKNQYQTQIELSHLAFEQVQQDQQGLVDLKKESALEGLQAQMSALELEEQAVQSSLDKEAALYDQDSVEYAAVQSKKLIAAQQFALESSRLTTEMAKAQEAEINKSAQAYKSVFDSIDRALDGMLQGILQGTETWQHAMAKLFDDLALSVIEDVVKMLAQWTAFEAATVLGGSGNKVATAIGNPFGGSGGASGSQSSPLQAAITALTSALGLSTAASTTQAAIGQSNQVITDTLCIATGANTTATIANTAAEGTSGGGGFFSSLSSFAAMAGLASFDVGSWSVPGDMLAMVHQGEMILPASTAAQVRSGAASLGGGGAAGGSNVNISINALDTQTGAQFLKNNAAVIAQTLVGQSRNFSPSAPGWRS